MTGFRNLFLGSVLGLTSVMPGTGFAAMPERPVTAHSDVLDARVVCDLSGCFETRRPPPGYEPPPPPPGYYRPPPPDYGRPPPPPIMDYGRPPPPPPGYYRPPPPDYGRPPPPPRFEERGRLPRRHVEWCLDRYQSYNPRTNSFLARDGRFRECRSPFY